MLIKSGGVTPVITRNKPVVQYKRNNNVLWALQFNKCNAHNALFYMIILCILLAITR